MNSAYQNYDLFCTAIDIEGKRQEFAEHAEILLKNEEESEEYLKQIGQKPDYVARAKAQIAAAFQDESKDPDDVLSQVQDLLLEANELRKTAAKKREVKAAEKLARENQGNQ